MHAAQTSVDTAVAVNEKRARGWGGVGGGGGEGELPGDAKQPLSAHVNRWIPPRAHPLNHERSILDSPAVIDRRRYRTQPHTWHSSPVWRGLARRKSSFVSTTTSWKTRFFLGSHESMSSLCQSVANFLRVFAPKLNPHSLLSRGVRRIPHGPATTPPCIAANLPTRNSLLSWCTPTSWVRFICLTYSIVGNFQDWRGKQTSIGHTPNAGTTNELNECIGRQRAAPTYSRLAAIPARRLSRFVFSATVPGHNPLCGPPRHSAPRLTSFMKTFRGVKVGSSRTLRQNRKHSHLQLSLCIRKLSTRDLKKHPASVDKKKNPSLPLRRRDI